MSESAEEILRSNAEKAGAEFVAMGKWQDGEHFCYHLCPRCESMRWRPEGDFRRCENCGDLWRPE